MLEKIVVVVVEMDDGKNIWQKVSSLCSPPKVDDNHLDDRSCAAAAEHFHQLIVVEICAREEERILSTTKLKLHDEG